MSENENDNEFLRQKANDYDELKIEYEEYVKQ